MTARYIILIVLSLAFGVGSVFLLLLVLNTFYNAGVNVQDYGYGFAFLTGFPIALAVAVWLDYFLGTNILPE
jgi:hypothetical protein